MIAALPRDSAIVVRKMIKGSWLGGSLALPSCLKAHYGRANLLMSQTTTEKNLSAKAGRKVG